MLKSLKRFGPVFLGPTPISSTFALLAPFVIGLYLSLYKFTAVTNAPFVGIQNYIDVFSERQGFIHTLFLTTAVAIVSVITINILAFVIACVLARRLKGTNFFRTISSIPSPIGGTILDYT